MLLTAIPGRINTYLSALKMENQWKERGTETARAKKTPNVDGWTDAVDETSEDSESKLERIVAKVDAGQKLTPSERRYLQEKDPDTYALLVQEEQEQQAFEKAARSCRSKEELERLRLWRVGRSMKAIKEIERNTNISPERKLKLVMKEKRVLDAANESVRTAARTVWQKTGHMVKQEPWVASLLVDCGKEEIFAYMDEKGACSEQKWTEKMDDILRVKRPDAFENRPAGAENTEKQEETGQKPWQKWSVSV